VRGLRRREALGRFSALAQLRHRITLLIFFACVDPFIDRRDLHNPTPPFCVLQIQHRIGRPVKVKGYEGYLLVQRLEGVA